MRDSPVVFRVRPARKRIKGGSEKSTQRVIQSVDMLGPKGVIKLAGYQYAPLRLPLQRRASRRVNSRQ
jgi:hypothetical protein